MLLVVVYTLTLAGLVALVFVVRELWNGRNAWEDYRD